MQQDSNYGYYILAFFLISVASFIVYGLRIAYKKTLKKGVLDLYKKREKMHDDNVALYKFRVA